MTRRSPEPCASCHTLADAKSQGTIGPNLDDAFSRDKHRASRASRRSATSSAARSPTRRSRCRRTSTAARTRATSRSTSRSARATRRAASPREPHRRPAGGDHDDGRRRRGGAPDGKQVFASAGCGGCHTLKDAGATGNVGPNLDDLKPSRRRSRTRSRSAAARCRPSRASSATRRSRRSRPTSLGRRQVSGQAWPQPPPERHVGRVAGPKSTLASSTSRSSRRSRAPSEPVWVVRNARPCGWRDRSCASSALPMPRRWRDGRTCSSTISKCGRSSHSRALLGRERRRDAVGPPLPGRARVAVAEPGDLAPVARDEEDEVVAPHVLGQALVRPFVGERAGAERRAVNLAQLARERQRVDGFDRQRRVWLEVDDDVGERDLEALARLLDDAALEPVRAARPDASRGSARRAGTCGSRPRSPGSGRRRRSRPPRRARGAHRREARVEARLRRGAGVVLVGDPVTERRVERGADDAAPARAAGARSRTREELRPADGLVRDDEDPVLVRRVRRRRLLRPAARARRGGSSQYATPAVSDDEHRERRATCDPPTRRRSARSSRSSARRTGTRLFAPEGFAIASRAGTP